MNLKDYGFLPQNYATDQTQRRKFRNRCSVPSVKSAVDLEFQESE